MFEPQHFVDLQENSGFGDSKSWLSDDHNSSVTHRSTQHSLANSSPSHRSTASGTNGNLDRVLFNDLVEIVPLVQSLIDRKESSSFTRLGSMTYTKTPSRESLSRKLTDHKGRNIAQSIPTKEKRGHGNQGRNNPDSDSFSIFSSRSLASEKEREELTVLREQVEDLQRKLLEKDELLKSADALKSQVDGINSKFNALKLQTAEKDSLIKSTQSQLSDAKIKLADKQAALEKIQWEAMTSNRKMEKLQEELKSVQGVISSFMMLLEGLATNLSDVKGEDYDFPDCQLGPNPFIDDLGEVDMQRMEEARNTYIAAVFDSKEKKDEESVAAASSARFRLQSFFLRTKNLD